MISRVLNLGVKKHYENEMKQGKNDTEPNNRKSRIYYNYIIKNIII